MNRIALLLCLIWSGPLPAGEIHNSTEPPTIPVGYDAFRQWDRWAQLRIGQRTYMTSTYDRRGGNESADASHFLYQLADDRNVTLDVMGAGVLAFARYNHWHGSPWHYIVDGRDYIVQETSTADPTRPVPNSRFIPESTFANPLAWTWADTKGADLSWVQIPFEQSFTMAYGRTRYGTGYYIYHTYLPGMTNLSQPIQSWSIDDSAPADVLDFLRKSGTDIAPPATADNQRNGSINLKSNETTTVLTLNQAPASIRAIQFTIRRDHAAAFGESRLKLYWDGAAIPSVDAPIKLFFGTGSLYNSNNREYLVKALPVNVRFFDDMVHFSMYFPMPFLKSAKMELVEQAGTSITGINWSVRFEPYAEPANWVGNFHATYVDHGKPTPGKDLVFLDTRKVEGGGDWCGHFVGTSFIFSDRAVLETLEGDPRFYFDDSLTPHAQGTGTEEWGGGGDYWGGQNMTLPFAGHPVGCHPKEAKNTKDPAGLVESAYRFLLADLMPFGRNAKITFEHGGENNSEEHYQSVTYWYGLHQPCLKITDTLHVGDAEDETRHQYSSPTASPVQTLSSRYEWGVDHLKGKEVYPESTDTGRNMTGTTTFTLKVDPSNVGVFLRRKFDYSFPNQCAKVFIADDKPDAPWAEAGVWYTAGSNTVIYSDARGELGATLHNIQTSNRRWREAEFLLPLDATKGRTSIRVKIEFVPRNIPLFPGQPLSPQAWSEYRYTAYCYVMPMVQH